MVLLSEARTVNGCYPAGRNLNLCCSSENKRSTEGGTVTPKLRIVLKIL